MRKSLYLFLPLAVLAAGCVDDIIGFDLPDESSTAVEEKPSTVTEEPDTETGGDTGTTDDTGSGSSSDIYSDYVSGTGTFKFGSTGDTSSDDDISNTTFTRLVTVTFSSDGASVEGDDGGIVAVNGNDVTVNNTGSENIVYRLTGSASDGSFTLYSSKKQAILLNGLALTNPDGAAINNQSGKRTFVLVEGTNTLSDGSSAAYSSQNDAMDSNGNMKLNGGYVFAVTTKGAPEVALDANTEGGYKLYINSGATVVAYGGLESGYSASQSVFSMSGTAGAWNALYDGKSFIAAFKAPSGVSSFAVSAPSLSKGYKSVSVSGTTYSGSVWATDGISGGTAVSLSNYSGGGSGGPGGGGKPW